MRAQLTAAFLALALLSPAALAATTLINTISNATADEEHAFQNFDVVSSALADFDGDGDPELVTQNDNKYVYVLSPTSTRVLAEFLPPYPSGWGARPLSDPHVADVDDDGALDIVLVTSAGAVCVYEYGSGWTFTKRWCKTMNTYGSAGADAGPAVADVNGDGKMEIFSQVETKGLYAFNHDGTVRWSKSEYGGNSGPLISDLDGDGKKEVLYFSDGGKVRAYDASSGSAKWVFYGSDYADPCSIPVAGNAADLDNDGKKEVVFSCRDAPDDDTVFTDNHLWIFVLGSSGSLKARWQPSFGNPLSYTHPVLIDVNGDGQRDILLQDWNTIGHKPGNWEKLGPANVFAYTRSGTLLWRTSLDNSWSNDDLAVADVDGDGKHEVLAIGYAPGGQDGIWYLDLRTGAKEAHVPLGSGWQALRGPIVGDLDGSGKTGWMVSVSGNGDKGWKVFKTDAACKVAFGGWANHYNCGDGDLTGGGDGGGETPPPPPPPTTGNYTFTHGGGNEWWVEAKVSPKPAAVQAMDTGGSWVTLSFKDWGEWAASFHLEPGNKVKFRAHAGDGAWQESCWFSHPGGVADCSGGTTTPPPPTNGTFSATFKNVRGNAWWVETDVTASGGTLAGVDARVDGGTWIVLAKQSYGSWAKSIHAPPGSTVEFRARATDGQSYISAGYAWPPS